MIEIFIEDLRWRGKLLVFTWHFKEEWDALEKPIEFVLEILEKGDQCAGRKETKQIQCLLSLA